jgi:filamentous hemagglutinin family protein
MPAVQTQVTRPAPNALVKLHARPRLKRRRALLHGVSLSALVAAGTAHAAGPLRSLNQALAQQSNTAVAAAAAGGGVTAAAAAGLGAQDLAKAAARFRSLSQALAGQNGAVQPDIPNGVVPGGLVQAPGVGSSTGGSLWVGANTKLGSKTVGGVTDITVTQTQSVADLTWKTFNVGAKTKLIFNQSAGGTLASSWVVINQIDNPGAVPTEILGDISAPGKVYIIDRNGIAFGAGSVVNVGSLIAATANIAQSQFGTSATGGLTFNLYGAATSTSYAPTFTDGSATADVTVAPGAAIETAVPSGATGGGYVMLLGGSVSNAGMIATPQGQTILAAGTTFTLRPGYSPTGNAASTTLGSEIAVSNGDTFSSGTALNSGVIVSDQGDITMVGHLVEQAGVLLSTTTVNQRGTVHLLTDTADTTAQVVLTPQSVTEILPEDNGETALDSQRAADIATSTAENAARVSQVGPALNDTNILPDQIEESRIEISTGGTVNFQSGALALAQGGQVMVGAGQAVVVQGGATIDVSGTSDAVLPATINSILVNIQQYQLRDSAGNRAGNLQNGNVYVDAAQLVDVASGAYAGNIYTPGGLLEVSGYLGLVPHGIEEWTAIGGQVLLQAGNGATSTVFPGEVITDPGSVINLTGGIVTYAAGQIPVSYVQAADGQIYNVNAAPGDLVYTGIYAGDVVTHPRWSVTDTYNNPLLTPSTEYSPEYVVGRDAGSLTVNAPTAVLQGTVDAGVTLGQYQTGARPANVTDPFLLAQTVVPLAGSLDIGDYAGNVLGGAYSSVVSFQDTQGASASVGTLGFLPPSLIGTVLIDAGQVSQDGFANITVSTTGTLSVTAPVSVSEGGTITLAGEVIRDAASLTARGGKIVLTNLLPITSPEPLSTKPGSISVSGGVTLSTQGIWTNAQKDPVHIAGEAFVNGGSVTLYSTGGLNLAAGSEIDASSGGALLANGKLLAASGGSVSITADEMPGSAEPVIGTARTVLDSSVHAYGVSGGGTFSLNVPVVMIGGSTVATVVDGVLLDPGFFQNGFSAYVLNGFYSAAVAAGTQVQVAMPVYANADAPSVPTGGDPASAYVVLLPALYVENKGSDSYTQRGGASFTLTSTIDPGLYNGGGGPVEIYQGASVTVDPKQSITLSGYGQETVLGTLTAQSGTISVLNTRFETTNPSPGAPSNYLPGLSVWLGGDSVLNASGASVSFTDSEGLTFGGAGAGGLIQLGIPASADTEGESTYAAIVVRPGALLNVAGAATSVNVIPGAETGQVVVEPSPVVIAGNGGTISARSYIGVALDGTMLAAAGASDAEGGSLILRLDDLPVGLLPNLVGEPQGLYTGDDIIVSENYVATITDPTLQPGQALPASAGGVARISQSQVGAAGFSQLTLYATNAISFDGSVDLAVNGSITLGSPAIGSAEPNGAITVSAPYIAIVGDQTSNLGGSNSSVGLQPLYEGPTAATLTFQAGLIDVQNQTDLGAIVDSPENTGAPNQGSSPVTTPNYTTYFGFATATFDSSGDIRFGTTAGAGKNVLNSSGNLTFQAAQLYPTTGASMIVAAGNREDLDLNQQQYFGTLTVLGLGGAAPQAPYSVGGTLQLAAGAIIQNGVIRAPEGEIVLGDGYEVQTPYLSDSETHPFVTNSVVLAPGSITSVSLDGQTIPYGGTLDGVNYNYNGSPVSTFDPQIVLQGQKITVSPGSVVDLSGGGTLSGAGFIPGRGGSIDVNTAPLISSVTGTVAATASDNVYAIVPSYKALYAPIAPGNAGYDAPAEGEQITVAAGEVPGLAAGTYTLLPAYYDLLPGAFRVELSNAQLPANFANNIGNFTTEAAVTLGTANTVVSAPVQTAALFTSGTDVRQLSQYDEESYNTFEVASAATFGSPRPLLPQDAKTLEIDIDQVSAAGQVNLSISAPSILQTPATGGYGATVEVNSLQPIEISAGGGVVATSGTLAPVGISTATLDALDVPRLVIGGTLSAPVAGVVTLVADTPEIDILPGADLTAGDVMLSVAPGLNGVPAGTITVSGGATVSTIGRGTTAYGLANGYSFNVDNGSLGSAATLDVSNTQDEFIPAVSSSGAALITIDSGAVLLAGGSLNFVAPPGAAVQIGQADLGGKYVDIEVASIDIGTSASLASDAAILPAGFALDTASFATLLDGDSAAGVPAASELILTASQSVNMLGSVSLNTGATDLVLNTPAIYGFGAATDAVKITAKDFTWSGISTVETLQTTNLTTISALPAGQIAGSASNIIGSLLISAGTITLGYGPLSQPDNEVTLDRLIAGFSNVTMQGTADITANNSSALAVYAAVPNFGQAGTGGNLTFDTPLLTSTSGAQLAVQAGGGFSLVNSGSTVANTGSVSTLGGSLSITAQQIAMDSAVALPAGSLSLTADGNQQGVTTTSTSTTSTTSTSTVVTDTSVATGTIANASIDLLAGANIDLSGRATKLFDQTAESPGGTLSLDSASGIVTTTTVTTAVIGDGPTIPSSQVTTTSVTPVVNPDLSQGDDITMAQGAAMNVSAPGANAGAISVSALGGLVDLEGMLTGGADASHTQGNFSLIAGAFGGKGSFDQLNTALQTGSFTGSRRFELATGNILVDQTVQASTVQITADTGSLEVSGTINASGASPGSIALSAGGNLTLDGGAVLDAHATGVARDSYGLDIDAENAAHVTLTSTAGTLTLDQGAVIDVLYSTNDPSKVDAAQGQVVLNAPRNGSDDANFAATGSVTIQGAASMSLVAWTQYAPGDVNGTIVQDNGGDTPVSASGTVGLNQVNTADQAYMAAALATPGPGLKSIAAALSAYGSLSTLLEPGVEIDSSAATGGNLTISGDLNFATFRYGPNANPTTGAGTPGVVLFRASNDLTVNGSVTDGFEAPPDSLTGNTLTGDTSGWVLKSNLANPFNQDVLLPSGATGYYKPGTKKAMETSQIELGAGSSFNTQRDISLNYDITIDQAALLSNVVIPFSAILGKATAPIPSGGWVATAPILSSSGTVLFAKGSLIPSGTVLQVGDVIQPGTMLPVQVTVFNNTLVPAGTPLNIFAGATIKLSADTGVLPVNALIPSNTKADFLGVFADGDVLALKSLDLRAVNTDGVQGYLYPLAEMLPAGSLSWSMNFVAGGNLGSANTLAVLPAAVLNAGGAVAASPNDNGAPGSLLLDDQHNASSIDNADADAAFSVIRTGTGNLNLVAGGNFDQSSLFGIYTAGTQDSADSVGTNADGFNAARYAYGQDGGVLPDNFTAFPSQDIAILNTILATSYQAYYPTNGGNVLVAAQANVNGDVLGTGTETANGSQPPSDAVGNWLWRQGSTQLGQPTAWWINFGTFVEPLGSGENDTGGQPALVGFEGIGALGGGNVTVIAGGNAGQITDRQGVNKDNVPSGEGLVVAVASTGRLALGSTTPTVTGGGAITIEIGGTLNPIDENAYQLGDTTNGDVIDLRGDVAISATAIGRITPTYSVGTSGVNEAAPVNDPRPANPFAQDNGLPEGGIVVVPGDGSVSIVTSGDLVLAGAGDPGRVPEQNLTAIDTSAYGTLVDNSGGFTGFSLWQPTTSISLFSSGGNVTPTTVPNDANASSTSPYITNDLPTDYRSIYPPTLLVTAATGDIIYGVAGTLAFTGAALNSTDFSLETAPAPNGQVAFLAGGSIFANGYAIDMSGASPAQTSLPTNPAFTSDAGLSGPDVITNIRGGSLSNDTEGTPNSALALFAFEADTPTTDLHANDPQPALFYAAGGDIMNFQTGETLSFDSTAGEPITTWYIAAKPVWIEASGDIVSSGVRPAMAPGSDEQENQATDYATPNASTSGNVFLNTGAQSISVVSAGQDILSGYFYVGGPGLLEVDAGRNLYQAAASTAGTQTLDFGDIRSLGSLMTGAQVSLTNGSSIAVLAGIGTGADYTAFADLYFNPANQANLTLPLSDAANKGKVQQVYATQLLAWLQTNQGYTGNQTGALAFFLALPQVQQDVFVREVFFDELQASGLQYNNPTSRFYHDYQRGQSAIDTLFPSTGTESAPGVPVGYTGAITMYSGTVPGVYTSSTSTTLATFDGGIATLFGGSIQVLDPGGQVELGISGGPAPGNDSGIITFGSGDIDIFTLGNVLLGQSRIFTTAGGNIDIWSADGDINAGIGAKTTVAYNPPVLTYDDTGGITDTPTVPTNGAGIATLAPLPSIPAGDVDLVAPLGTIDAGEAGIRVSGNLNLAAAHLENTANISVGGKTTGTPTVTVASLGAVEAAGAAAGAAASTAQSSATHAGNENAEAGAVIEVDVISIGGTYEEDQRRKKKVGS